MALPKLNLAALRGGPAMIYHGPTAVYTKTGVDLDASPNWEDLTLDGFDVVDKRKKAQPIAIKYTPSGVYNASHIAALCSLITLPLGSFITPRFPGATFDHTSGHVTVTAHGRRAGESGYVAVAGNGGVVPAGLDAATLYYLGVVDADTLTLHTTQADALAGSNAVAFTGDGTAPLSLVINNPFIIHSYTGDVLTFWNHAVENVPDLELTASGKTIFGEVTVGAFLRHGFAPQDANSYYTRSTAAFDPTTFPDLSTILTQPYEANWGNTAPWDNIRTKEGFKMKFGAKVEDVEVDGVGVPTKQLTGATAEVSFIPTDADEGDLLDAQKIQGTALGSSLQAAANDLNIIGTGFYARLYKAGFTKTPAKWNMKDRRAGEVTLMATRQFPGGVPQPLMFLGTAAPE